MLGLSSRVPQDVYTGVAEEVQKIAEADAQEGVLAAQALLGNITRKLVKQTVMTSVYGVTSIGAREQIQVTPAETRSTGGCHLVLCRHAEYQHSKQNHEAFNKEPCTSPYSHHPS